MPEPAVPRAPSSRDSQASQPRTAAPISGGLDGGVVVRKGQPSLPAQHATEASHKIQELIKKQSKHPLDYEGGTLAKSPNNVARSPQQLQPIHRSTQLPPSSNQGRPLARSLTFKSTTQPATHNAKKSRIVSAVVRNMQAAKFGVEEKISPFSLWHRLSLGRQSAAEVAQTKEKGATKVQAVFRTLREKLKFRDQMAVKKQQDAVQVCVPSRAYLSIQNAWRNFECNLQLALEHRAASKLQNLYRARKARYLLRQTMLIVYEKRQDPRTGMEFFYNRRTGASQWDAPLLAKQLVCQISDKNVGKGAFPLPPHTL